MESEVIKYYDQNLLFIHIKRLSKSKVECIPNTMNEAESSVRVGGIDRVPRAIEDRGLGLLCPGSPVNN